MMIYMEVTVKLIGEQYFKELIKQENVQIKKTEKGINYILIEEL